MLKFNIRLGFDGILEVFFNKSYCAQKRIMFNFRGCFYDTSVRFDISFFKFSSIFWNHKIPHVTLARKVVRVPKEVSKNPSNRVMEALSDGYLTWWIWNKFTFLKWFFKDFMSIVRLSDWQYPIEKTSITRLEGFFYTFRVSCVFQKSCLDFASK